MNYEYSPYYDFSNYQHHYMPNRKNISIDNNKQINLPEIVNLEEGLTRGNMFRNLYSPWKNYKEYIERPTKEKDKLLLDIQMLSFAIIDLSIYLDMYPNDKQCLDYFNQYRNKCIDVTKEYEKKYGPLSLSSYELENYPFNWINEPWPWEGE